MLLASLGDAPRSSGSRARLRFLIGQDVTPLAVHGLVTLVAKTNVL